MLQNTISSVTWERKEPPILKQPEPINKFALTAQLEKTEQQGRQTCKLKQTQADLTKRQ